jgi:hypothetical protein
VKTTIEIPDRLSRKAKSTAAERGQSLTDFAAGFGGLRRLRGETRRIQAAIDETFETIDPEDRQ